MKKNNIKEMKTLHEKAGILLELAEGMQKKIDRMLTHNIEQRNSFLFSEWTDEQIDTCQRGLKRLIYSYQKTLMKIAEL
jgi:ABC-type siderophore export system fused ATPase/permease subunit